MEVPPRTVIFTSACIVFATAEARAARSSRTGMSIWRISAAFVPHFVVFYNGKEDAPDQYDLRLSDAFEKETEDPEIELVCHVYNINSGKNTP